MLKRFEKISGFSLRNDFEEEVGMDDLYGRYTVLYFYPKAFTPGCTKECNAFSENIEEFISFKMDDLTKEIENISQDIDLSEIVFPEINVIGISPDTPERLAKFRDKYNLKVDLLSDPDREAASIFGVLKENGSSILRSTFILDPWNRVRKSWYGVKVNGHVEEVLTVLREIIAEDISINPHILERRARRTINPELPVPRMMLEQMVRAAHLAPSCFNHQPWRFSIIDEKGILEKLHEHIPSGNYWLKKAPALIAVYSRIDDDCQLSDRRDYFLFDTGMSVGNLLTQATQMGLIAHPVAGYNPEGFKKELNIKEEDVLITVIGVGFPDNIDYLNEKHQEIERNPRDRMELEKVLNWN